MVELVSRQGRVGADVLSLRPIVRAAYSEECDFSIGFLSARRASTLGGPMGLIGFIGEYR